MTLHWKCLFGKEESALDEKGVMLGLEQLHVLLDQWKLGIIQETTQKKPHAPKVDVA